MSDLDPRQLTLLHIVAAGEGALTTRSIDIRLSQRHPPSAETVLQLLKRLQAEGYIRRMVAAGSPYDAWALTDAGRSLLHRVRQQSTEPDVGHARCPPQGADPE
jgi:DNA-binding PadR family transcriptional regulator